MAGEAVGPGGKAQTIRQRGFARGCRLHWKIGFDHCVGARRDTRLGIKGATPDQPTLNRTELNFEALIDLLN